MIRLGLILLLLVSQDTIAAPPENANRGQSAVVYGKSEITIKTRTQGEIIEARIKEGQSIKRGELIAQLDDRQERIDKDLAESEYKLAKEDFEKTQKLKKYVSTDELNQKEANLLKKKSVFNTKLLEIDKKRIVSPIDGIVTRIHFQRGDTVGTGEKFAEVVQMDDLVLVANVASSEAQRFKNGLTVQFKVEGRSETYQSKVIYASPVIDPSSDTVRIKLETKNLRGEGSMSGDYLLKPGMIATLLN